MDEKYQAAARSALRIAKKSVEAWDSEKLASNVASAIQDAIENGKCEGK